MFHHLSFTRVGNSFNDVKISLIAKLAYESMIEHLKSDNLPFKGLNDKPRSIDFVQASDIITRMKIDKPVYHWLKTLTALDI
jgi:hypothetical protein